MRKPRTLIEPSALARHVFETVLLLLLIAAAWSYAKSWRQPVPNPPPSSASSTANRGHSTTATAIADRHLFGSAATETQSNAISDVSITIIGILAADDERDSVALVMIDGAEKSVMVGQDLPDGEAVAHIESAALVLSRAGATRRIEMQTRYADSNAVFSKAAMDGDGKISWADAYQDGTESGSTAHPPRAGIASVPAAIMPQSKGLSLQEIREARASHFATFRATSGARPSVVPGNPPP